MTRLGCGFNWSTQHYKLLKQEECCVDQLNPQAKAVGLLIRRHIYNRQALIGIP